MKTKEGLGGRDLNVPGYEIALPMLSEKARGHSKSAPPQRSQGFLGEAWDAQVAASGSGQGRTGTDKASPPGGDPKPAPRIQPQGGPRLPAAGLGSPSSRLPARLPSPRQPLPLAEVT